MNGNRLSRLAVCCIAAFCLAALATCRPASAAIYRWDTGALITTKNAEPSAELQNMDLSYADLVGANLTHANFTRSTLTLARLSGADLLRARLDDATLTQADLSGATLAHATAYEASFSSANLFGADLTGAALGDTVFSGADLRGANLTDAICQSSDFTNANLSGADLTRSGWVLAELANADFSGAIIKGAEIQLNSAQLYSTASYQQKDLAGVRSKHCEGWDLSEQNLTGAELTWLTGANLRRANLANALLLRLSGADLAGANLTSAYLYGADASNASFRGANLKGADCGYVNFTGADLSDAIVTGVNFSKAVSRGFTAAQLYSTASYRNGDLANIGMKSNNLTGWDLSDANLRGANFTGAVANDADFRRSDLTGASFVGVQLFGAKLNGALVARVNFLYAGGLTAGMLYSTASYQQGNLTGIGLEYHDLSGWSFAGKDLTGANFGRATLKNTDFTGAIIRGANLEQAVRRGFTAPQLYSTASYQQGDLSRLSLIDQQGDGTRWNFAGKTLIGADLRGFLEGADFTAADLTGATISGADGANFSSANAPNAMFGPANHASFSGANLANATFYDSVDGADFHDATLAGAKFWDPTNIFKEVNAKNANLRNANLSGASFYRTWLENADFAGARVEGADFRWTTAKGFTAPQLYSTGGYQQGNLRRVRFDLNDLSGWSFAGKDLTGTTFYYADLTDADFSGAVVAEASFGGEPGHDPTDKTLAAPQLYATASYQAKDLRGISLCLVDLAGWSFAGQNLVGAKFQEADLTGTDFSGADLSGADFLEAELSGTLLSGAIVRGTIFDRMLGPTPLSPPQLYSTASYQARDLRGISLDGNRLQGCNLAGQDLSGAGFYRAHLIGADFSGANLTDVDFKEADLSNADFSGATVTGADFTPRWDDLSFRPAQLYSTASYQAHDLRGITLGVKDLGGWDFTGQDLTGASFEQSRLHGVNLTDAVIRDAVFDATVPINPSQPGLEPETFYATASYKAKDLRGVSLNDNDLRGWNFAGQDLTGASFHTSRLGGADFTAAIVRETIFDRYDPPSSSVPSDAPLHAEQLYATASYQAEDLRGISLGGVDLWGWSFRGQNLAGASFRQSDLAGADFTGADLTGVDLHLAKLPAQMPMLPVVADSTVTLDQDTTVAASVLIDEGGRLELGGDARVISILGDVVNNGLIATGQRALRIEGEVTGSGNTTGYVIFAGGYSPGGSPAVATHENIVLEATSVLRMELGGPVPGVEHDQLIVTGAALLDGTLAIELIDGYTPRPGDQLTLFQWSAVSGTFSNTLMPEGLVLDFSRLYADGTILVVVPEPGTLVLLIIGAFGLLLVPVWRRKTTAGP